MDHGSGNSVSENVGVKHLLNIKTIAEKEGKYALVKVPEKSILNMEAYQLHLKN